MNKWKWLEFTLAAWLAFEPVWGWEFKVTGLVILFILILGDQTTVVKYLPSQKERHSKRYRYRQRSARNKMTKLKAWRMGAEDTYALMKTVAKKALPNIIVRRDVIIAVEGRTVKSVALEDKRYQTRRRQFWGKARG